MSPQLRTLFLITARGGSKGVPKKNIRTIGGLPLVAFKALAARQSKSCTRLVLSSDDAEIQDVARRFGVEVPFTRPAELASDTAGSADVIAHAIAFFEARGETYDAIMLLEPSSPFTRPEDYDAAVDLMRRTNAQAVLGMRRSPVGSTYIGPLDADGRISSIVDKMHERARQATAAAGHSSVLRQSGRQEYTMNGALYLFRWEYFKTHRDIYADRDGCFGYVMPDEYSIEIDEPSDLRFAEFLVEKGHVDLSIWKTAGADGSGKTGPTLYQRAKKVIPGGTQLLSKRPEMFLPDQWPSYYSKAKGADVWDLDGTRYLDMTHFGVGACVLGHADADVDAAARNAIDCGVMSTLNCPEEVELAELLIELHPWAEMVRYARGGGEAMAMAARIARAATGRDVVAFCGYHGWQDWYLASNLADDTALDGHLLEGLEPRGVPRGLTGTMLPFHYNDIDAFRAIVAAHGRELAAVVMEPSRSHGPAAGFLEEIRRTTREIGAVLVFDEITSGFRQNAGGIHLTYGVDPDLATFAKGMSNGYAMAAVIGVGDVMQAAQRSFISSTFWTERIGPSAALATIRKYRRENVAAHLVRIGTRVQAGWRQAAAAAGLTLDVGGIPPLSHFAFVCPAAASAMTLFTQQMLERGFLAGGSLYTSFAHTDEHVDRYLDAVNHVFRDIAAALRDDSVLRRLRGPVKHAGFQRLAD